MFIIYGFFSVRVDPPGLAVVGQEALAHGGLLRHPAPSPRRLHARVHLATVEGRVTMGTYRVFFLTGPPKKV